MSLRNWNRSNSFSFKLVSALVLITIGMLLAVSLPSIKQIQSKYINEITSRSKSEKDQRLKSAYLSAAALIGANDPIATQNLANYYLQAGEYDKALGAYQSTLIPINNVFMGNLALRSSNTNLANYYFSRANGEGESAESQAGLAFAAFIKGDTGTGCNYANRAKKLNLSSTAAEQAGLVCDILNGKSQQPANAQAYTLINNSVYDTGLKKLEDTKDKSSQDWYYIAKVYANRGVADRAEEALKKSLELNPSNKQSLILMTKLMINSGKTNEAAPYQDKLKELEFNNFK